MMGKRIKMRRRSQGDYIDDGDDNQGMVSLGSGRRPDADPTLRTMQLVDKAVDQLKSELQTRFESVDTRFLAIDKATAIVHDDYVRVPTVVDKAVGALRELLEARTEAHEAIMELARERIADVEDKIVHRPEAIRVEVEHLKEFIQQSEATAYAELNGKIEKLIGETKEKFAGVAAQFSERDTRTDQRAGDTKLAVDAAFAAAKEATAKIEAGFTKQIDAMISIIDTKTGNLAGAIGDIKDRLTAIEARGAVSNPTTDANIASLMSEVRSLRDAGYSGQGRSAATTEVRRDSRDHMGLIAAIAAAVIVLGALFLKSNGLH